MKEDGCVDEVGGNHTIMNQCGRSEMKKGGIHTRERACFFFFASYRYVHTSCSSGVSNQPLLWWDPHDFSIKFHICVCLHRKKPRD
jgi:hypothetical protein